MDPSDGLSPPLAGSLAKVSDDEEKMNPDALTKPMEVWITEKSYWDLDLKEGQMLYRMYIFVKFWDLKTKLLETVLETAQ